MIIEGKILAMSVGEGADWKETMRSLLKVGATVRDVNVHLKKKPLSWALSSICMLFLDFFKS